MKTYRMEVITQVLTISASSQEEAEAKYEAHFDESDCPCGSHSYDCDCVEVSEETYHLTTELVEEVSA